MVTDDGMLRVAAMADIHYGKKSAGSLQQVFAQVAREAEVLLLCGDLTDYGLTEEAQILATDLAGIVKVIPVLAVLGNHDYESGQQTQVVQVLSDGGVVMLDGETCEVNGVGFAGVKGFCGGFGQYLITPWGEQTMKLFVRDAVDEALKLETALAKLVTPQRVAVLHYAPIRETVEGESPEIFAFAGCSRLEDPLDHFQVAAAFHGHAHHGTFEGRTRAGVPVYNVALPVLKRARPEQPPYFVVEVPKQQPGAGEEVTTEAGVIGGNGKQPGHDQARSAIM